MLQINVFTDLFFASGIVGAAAGLGYANLLVQTPLGLISNALLVPLLPTFARLTAPEDQPQLLARIRQGLMLSTASMVPIGALFIALGTPIVALVYERGAFDSSAAQLVAVLLMAYGLGMPAYLGRDVLVRVFYALGDGTTPFRLSLAGIGLNVIFDWVLVGGPTPWGSQSPFNFGASGLVLATVAINVLTCLTLLLVLKRRMPAMTLIPWGIDTTRLLLAGVLTGCIVWGLSLGVDWPLGWFGLLARVGIPSLLGLTFFGLIGSAFGVAEVQEIGTMVMRRMRLR
jgi:putative peptidoglycan lipid II flippase